MVYAWEWSMGVGEEGVSRVMVGVDEVEDVDV